jgi:uncharacterized protein (TIGR03435 family)
MIAHRPAMLPLLAAFAWTQTFEVASVKPSGPQSVRNSEGGPGTSVPGRFRFTSATLIDLLARAYGVDYGQISSKLPLDGDRYDVVANVPDAATKDQFRTMLQNLLAERFRMKVHHETREFSGYELLVAKSGLKIAGSRPGPEKPSFTTTFTLANGQSLARTRSVRTPISDLLPLLQRAAGGPVVDRTGLTGAYDYTLEYASQLGRSLEAAPEAPLAPAIFTAVQQQLGLQLVARKIPLDMIIVESFDRVPSEN